MLVEDEETGFAYNPETGRLYKCLSVTNYARTIDKENMACYAVEGIRKPATHIIFKIMTGRWPKAGLVIDHRNRNRRDNRWVNLREATLSQNMYNRQPQGKSTTDEILEIGVYKHGNRYFVKIGDTTYGRFSSREEANRIARVKRRELHGEFAIITTAPTVRRVK